MLPAIVADRDVMKKFYAAVLLTAVLSGCDTANLHLTEQQYEDSARQWRHCYSTHFA